MKVADNLRVRRLGWWRGLAITALGVFGVSTAMAQGPSALNGTWVNVDPHTRGLVRIQIDGRKIHPFGQCHPDPCDWGNLKGKTFSGDVNNTRPAAMTATHKTGFSRVEMTLTLEAGGRLRAELFTHFTDESSRADYRSVDVFYRERAPYRR